MNESSEATAGGLRVHDLRLHPQALREASRLMEENQLSVAILITAGPRAVPLVPPGRSQEISSQDVRTDAVARRAWLGDRELDLTLKEFDLLSLLVSEAGKVVTRDQIMRQVWAGKWGSTKTLDMHVTSLRRKLGDDARSPRYIITVRSVGFRFEALEPEARLPLSATGPEPGAAG